MNVTTVSPIKNETRYFRDLSTGELVKALHHNISLHARKMLLRELELRANEAALQLQTKEAA